MKTTINSAENIVNEKNIAPEQAKKLAQEMTEKANAPQVEINRVNVNPVCFASNFVAELQEHKIALDNAVSVYKSTYTEKGDIVTAWTNVETALNDYNKAYKALQIDALRNAGTAVYVASPMCKACKIRRDKDGLYKSTDFVDVPVLPTEFDSREKPMFVSNNWRKVFEALANACGFVFGAECAFENKEGTSSRAKIKNALADCIKAVFGSECKYSPRSSDVSALLYSVASRDTRNVNSFKKMDVGMFRWCIIDTIGAAMCGASYKFTVTKKDNE